MSKQCPSCGGSGKDVGINQKGKDGWTETTHASCSTCGGMGYVNEFGSDSRGGSKGSGGSGCFPSSTMIKTASGSYRIDSFKDGDIVLTYNKATGLVTEGRILKHVSHAPKSIWEFHFEDGRKIRTTEVHSFLVNGKWVQAKNIISGQYISVLNEQGKVEDSKVIISRETAEIEPVYNLIVSKGYSFFADGVISHSFTYFRGTRSLIWSIRNFLSKDSQLICQVKT